MKDYSNLSDSDGEKLVKMARAVVTKYLKTKNRMKLDSEFEEAFSANAGVFVTLNHQFNLRGCIGYVLPDKKLYNALEDAAIAAATEDPRFPPVTYEELDQITFEVTVLTPPQEIEVIDPKEYPSKIKVGRDGLIVKSGFNSGLLLPQVPKEYGWDEEEFLGHTCKKAGLHKEQWKEKDTKILKFEGVVFKEETPGGSVVREKL